MHNINMILLQHKCALRLRRNMKCGDEQKCNVTNQVQTKYHLKLRRNTKCVEEQKYNFTNQRNEMFWIQLDFSTVSLGPAKRSDVKRMAPPNAAASKKAAKAGAKKASTSKPRIKKAAKKTPASSAKAKAALAKKMTLKTPTLKTSPESSKKTTTPAKKASSLKKVIKKKKVNQMGIILEEKMIFWREKKHLFHLLLVGSLLQLRELDLDERLQVKTSSSRTICCSSEGLHGATLDPHLVDLLCRALLDQLGPDILQGRGLLRRSNSLLGAFTAGLQLASPQSWSLQGLFRCKSSLGLGRGSRSLGGSLLCSFLDSRLACGCGSFLGASFGSLLGSSRVFRSHAFDV